MFTMWWKISELLANLEDFSQLDQKQHACYMFLFKVSISWLFVWIGSLMEIPYNTIQIQYNTNQLNVGKYTIHGSYGILDEI